MIKIKTIMCDDEPDLLYLFTEELKPLDFLDITTVTDSEEIMNSNEPYCLAILDLHLPKYDGLDVARHLLSLNSKTNLIFVTGHECRRILEFNKEQRLKKLYPAMVFEKPFDPGTFLEYIRALFPGM